MNENREAEQANRNWLDARSEHGLGSQQEQDARWRRDRADRRLQDSQNQSR